MDFSDQTIQILKFSQISESQKPNYVILHIPIKSKMFWSSLHPEGSLYQDYPNIEKAITQLEDLKKKLEDQEIQVFTFFDAIRMNKSIAKKYAKSSLTYSLSDQCKTSMKSETYEKYASDAYKDSIIEKMSIEELFEILLHQPIVYLEPDTKNTGIITKKIEIKPLGNLIFTRDQQIITQKGIILGKMNSEQRADERKIIEMFYEILKQKVIGHIPEDTRMEGGDFFVLNDRWSLLGVGLRTKIESAVYLMENDLIGTKYFGVVQDEYDLDQDRMHLDTIFNILSEKEVVLLDFDTVPKKFKDGKELDLRRRITIFRHRKNNEDISNGKTSYGNYEFQKKMDFEEFLKEQQIIVHKIPHQYQMEYMINFLNIGNKTIISCHERLEKFLEERNSEVKVKFIDYGEVKKMYGALHCTTQAIRTPFSTPQKGMLSEHLLSQVDVIQLEK